MTALFEEPGSRTIFDYLEHWKQRGADQVWLRDRKGDEFPSWTWREADDESQAVAAWLEAEFGSRGTRMALLSRNRAHWMLADMAIVASGNVSVPIFTTQSTETTSYILDFADVQTLFLGEAENWEKVRAVVPNHVRVVALPGVEPACDHQRWDDIVDEHRGRRAAHRAAPEDLISLVFTSGTTGAPKGVMQTHESMVIPMERGARAFAIRDQPRFLSYLPLAHVAERQLIWIQSLVHGGEVTFNESLPHLVRDMSETRPSFFFGAPRVWEQLQQGLLAKFGSQEALDEALAANEEQVAAGVRAALGLDDADYLLTAAAPTPPALIQWYKRLGIELLEGYGQTEAMSLIANTRQASRIGSIGKPIEGVEVKILESGELICKAPGLATGYFEMPDKTAETFVDGWVHTGDKVRVDEDGFYYITGRVKDYFKTIQGKFVAPAPIEGLFAEDDWVEQQCLLGRGYSKTAMVCVLSELARAEERATLEQNLLARVESVNAQVDKHARIGAVLVAPESWSIENGALTPTLKIKRDEIEARYGARAETLAHDAAVRGRVMIEWMG